MISLLKYFCIPALLIPYSLVYANPVAIGRAVENNGSVIASDNGAKATGSGVAIGKNSQSTEDASVSIGADSTSPIGWWSSVSIGKEASGAGPNTVAIGSLAKVLDSSNDTVVLGANSRISGRNNVAIGANADGSMGGGDVLGADAVSSNYNYIDNYITISSEDYYFSGSGGKTLSIGNDSSKRQIQNVAAGQLSEQSTDAVNGSQLYAVVQAVETLQGRGQDTSIQLENLTSMLDQYDKKLSAAIAATAAAAGVPVPAIQGKTSVGIGLGHHNKQSAIAISGLHTFYSGITIQLTLASSLTQTTNVFNIGFAYNW